MSVEPGSPQTEMIEEDLEILPIYPYNTMQVFRSQISTFYEESKEHYELFNQENKILTTNLSSTGFDYKIMNIHSELPHLDTKEKIEKFLLNEDLNGHEPIPLLAITKPVSILYNKNYDNFGARLLFATFTKSFSLIGSFLYHQPTVQEPKSNDKFAKMAVDLLLQTQLPPLFFPQFNSETDYEIEVPQLQPIIPTAMTCSDSTLYVGIKGPTIAMIPMKNSMDRKIEFIPIRDFPDEPFSIAYVQGSLFLSSKTTKALHFDTNSREQFPINLFYPINFMYILEKRNPFEPPIVTDGQKFYSVEFGPTPKVKIFLLEPDSIMFESCVNLKPGKIQLTEPFAELLPLEQKNTALIASNGIYLSVIMKSGSDTICRIFLLYDGTHLHDVKIQTNEELKAWCFNTSRPAHVMLMNEKISMLDGCFTLPPWITGYILPTEKQEIKSRKNDDIFIGYSRALSIFVSRFIGTDTNLNLSFLNECGDCPIEQQVEYFITQAYNFTEDANCLEADASKYAENIRNIANGYKSVSNAFLVVLAIKLRQEPQILKFSSLLDKFLVCIKDEKYSYIKNLIAYVMFSSLDSFVLSDSQRTSMILKELIEDEKYTNMMFKWFPKSKYVSRVITIDSLHSLCNMSLKTHYVFDDQALPLMKVVQHGFIMDINTKMFESKETISIAEHSVDFFTLYVGQLIIQFKNDFEMYRSEQWSKKLFTNSVSLLVFDDLLKQLCSQADNIVCHMKIIEMLIDMDEISELDGDKNYVIQKIFSRALYLAFRLAINMVVQQKCFYPMENRAEITEKYDDFIKLVRIKEFSCVPKEISDEIIFCIYRSYRDHVPIDLIRKDIYQLFQKLAIKEINTETINERIKFVKQYLPQPYNSVILALNGSKIDIIDNKTNIKVYTWFINRMTMYFAKRSKNYKIIFSFMIPRIKMITTMLKATPIEYLNKFISGIDYWPFFPVEILKASTVQLSVDLNNIDNKLLKKQYKTFLEIAYRLNDQSSFLENFKNITVQSFFNTDKVEDLTALMMKLHITIRSTKSIKNCQEKLLELAKETLFDGNYKIVKLLLRVYKELYFSGFEDVQFIEYAVSVIREFILFKRFLIASPGTIFNSLQIIFQILAFFRDLLQLKIKSVYEYVKNLITQNDFVFFMICSNIDIPRPGLQINYTENLLKMTGKIKKMSNEIFVVDFNGKSKELTKTTQKTITVTNVADFDTSVFENDYEAIYKLFANYKQTESILNPFYVSSISQFCKSSDFCKIIDLQFVNHLFEFINNRYICSLDSHWAMFQHISEYLNSNYPLFTLLAGTTKPPPSSLPSAKALHNTLIEHKVVKNKVSNFVISLNDEKRFISTNLSSHFSSHVKMHTESNLIKNTYRISIEMVDTYFKKSYTTGYIAVSGEVEIKVDPTQQLLLLIANGEVQKYTIAKSSHAIFFSVTIPPSTVLYYDFDTEYDFIDTNTFNYGKSLTPNTANIQKPFSESSLFVLSKIKRASNVYSMRMAILALKNIFDFKCEIFDIDMISKFLPIYLLSIDDDLKSNSITIKDQTVLTIIDSLIKRNLSGEILTKIVEFVNTMSCSVKDDLSCSSIESVSHSINTLTVLIRHSISLFALLCKDRDEFISHLKSLMHIAKSHNINSLMLLFKALVPEKNDFSNVSFFKEKSVFTELIERNYLTQKFGENIPEILLEWRSNHSQVLWLMNTISVDLTEEGTKLNPLIAKFPFEVIDFFNSTLNSLMASDFRSLILEHTCQNMRTQVLSYEKRSENHSFSVGKFISFDSSIPKNKYQRSALIALGLFKKDSDAISLTQDGIDSILSNKTNESFIFQFISGVERISTISNWEFLSSVSDINLSPIDFISMLAFKCSNSAKEYIIETVKKMHPFVVGLLMFAATNFRNVTSFKNSANFNSINVIDGVKDNIEFNKELAIISIGEVTSPEIVTKKLMNCLYSYL